MSRDSFVIIAGKRKGKYGCQKSEFRSLKKNVVLSSLWSSTSSNTSSSASSGSGSSSSSMHRLSK